MLTTENTEGYTQDELDKLNDEFENRYKSGEWDYLGNYESDRRAEAEKQFSNEVARR